MAFRVAERRAFLLLLLLLHLSVSHTIFAGGSDESASADRGEYVAESGQIISPDEIEIKSYVARIDYDYPDPTDSIGISIQSSQQRVSTSGQELLIQIGIQGERGEFESIPPLNISFLFDASGSMSAADKIDYVRISLDTLLERLRPIDQLSVIAFSETPQLILPSTTMSRIDTEALRKDVAAVLPLGIADLDTAYREAGSQVLEHFDREAVNRIILLSDGLVQTGESVNLASEFFSRGIGTTAIGVGSSFNLNLIVDISKAGGGSSRFLTNKDKINEVFFTDFDRAIYPVAYKLEMELKFLEDVEILGHWGYDGEEGGDSITFTHPSVHFRDYETILIRVRTPRTRSGARPFATFETRYTDRAGHRITAAPETLNLTFADNVVPSPYPTDRRVLLGGTILDVAQALKDIGTLYYSMETEQERVAALGTANRPLREIETGEPFTSMVSRESAEFAQSQQYKIRRCLDFTLAMKHRVVNVHLRLDTDIFESELKILDAYIKTLGSRLRITESVLEAMKRDSEFGLPAQTDELDLAVQAIAGEVFAGTEVQPGDITFIGFMSPEDGSGRIIERLDRVFTASMPSGAIKVAPEGLYAALDEHNVTKADMLDTGIAGLVGKSLKTDLLVVGYLLPLTDSFIVMVRLIDVETGAVHSATQTILKMTEEFRELIDGKSDHS